MNRIASGPYLVKEEASGEFWLEDLVYPICRGTEDEYIYIYIYIQNRGLVS
jgi:hypothetical protein